MSSSLFNYFNVYRIVIAILLAGMTFSQKFVSADFRDFEAFQVLAFAYVFVCLISLLGFRYLVRVDERKIFASTLIDIGFLHALFYVSQGISGGLSNLLVISVAAANIMLRGAPAYALAAFATLLSLLLELERFSEGLSRIGDVARAGLMGVVYFAAAFILQNLARRISQSESLAAEQQQDIFELQALNHQIIQSMRTGIIVCDRRNRVKMLNQACTDLIGMELGQPIPRQISKRIEAWNLNPSIRTEPFQMSDDLPIVQANFSRMGQLTLIFLEDIRLVAQQAQQLKLASLGRLTASIAHEVRNPLGAISHATQLLAESEQLHPADRKMTDIIQRHSARVNSIIENTLSLTRRDEPDAQEVKLKPWIEKVIANYLVDDSKAKRIVFEPSFPEALARFDPSQIEQVLTNLIDNSLHHGKKCREDARVFIRLDVNIKTGQAYIEIEDEGNGISEENQKHLFEPFFTTESQGTGLGLYLSKELCEANQASLRYVHKQNKGACFKLIFAHHKRIV
jgi:two-component system sensor histidine kinase PilS (NtrC family)